MITYAEWDAHLHPDPRTRYLRLLQAWVQCLPHQPAKRRFIEGALARARAQVVGRRTP